MTEATKKFGKFTVSTQDCDGRIGCFIECGRHSASLELADALGTIDDDGPPIDNDTLEKIRTWAEGLGY